MERSGASLIRNGRDTGAMVRYGAVRYGAVWYGAVRYGAVRCGGRRGGSDFSVLTPYSALRKEVSLLVLAPHAMRQPPLISSGSQSPITVVSRAQVRRLRSP